MKAFVLAIFLFCHNVYAKTLIFPIQDVIMEIPTFTNAPSFNLNNYNPVGNSSQQPRKTRRQREQELINLMWTQYPNADSINIYNGNLIIRTSEK